MLKSLAHSTSTLFLWGNCLASQDKFVLVKKKIMHGNQLKHWFFTFRYFRIIFLIKIQITVHIMKKKQLGVYI